MNRIKNLIGAKGWEIEHEEEFDVPSLFQCSDPEWSFTAGFQSPPTANFIRELAGQLSGKAAENAVLRQQIEELTERIDKHEQLLNEILAPSGLPENGAFEQWLTLGDPVNAYRGKHVAFVSGKGIVASSDSLDDLVERVDAMGKIEGLVIGFVPVASAAISKC